MSEDIARYIKRRRRELGETIKKSRSDSGWTQQQVANFLGCSRRRINRIEQGQSDFAISELELLVAAFGVSLESLTETKGSEFAIDNSELVARRFGVPLQTLARIRKHGLSLSEMNALNKKYDIPLEFVFELLPRAKFNQII